MANWITHEYIADVILSKNFNLDEHSFCVGNIAPDCNIENSDFTKYMPSREKTHWMSQKHKTDVDYQNYYNDILRDQKFNSKQRLSFLLGYYSHLITDVEFHKFMNDKNQIAKTFQRLKADSNMRTRIKGFPETKSTLKQVFDRWTLLGDIISYENSYVLDHPDCSYNRILRKTKEFPEYL